MRRTDVNRLSKHAQVNIESNKAVSELFKYTADVFSHTIHNERLCFGGIVL